MLDLRVFKPLRNEKISMRGAKYVSSFIKVQYIIEQNFVRIARNIY